MIELLLDLLYSITGAKNQDRALCEDLRAFVEDGFKLYKRTSKCIEYRESDDSPDTTLLGLVTRYTHAGVEMDVITDAAWEVSRHYQAWLLGMQTSAILNRELDSKQAEDPTYADGLQERIKLLEAIKAAAA
tara:strand:+ start:2047 stop:2442 length:396 start_codon:yes stop_codon:yes gene_type:complete